MEFKNSYLFFINLKKNLETNRYLPLKFATFSKFGIFLREDSCL